MTRSAARERTTKETSISVAIDLDGPTGQVTAATGLPFFDHMLDQIGRHGGFDLAVQAAGGDPVDVCVAHLASPGRAGQLTEKLAQRLADNL